MVNRRLHMILFLFEVDLTTIHFIVSYDSESGLHSVYTIRKCEEEDLVNQSEFAPDVIGTPMMLQVSACMVEEEEFIDNGALRLRGSMCGGLHEKNLSCSSARPM